MYNRVKLIAYWAKKKFISIYPENNIRYFWADKYTFNLIELLWKWYSSIYDNVWVYLVYNWVVSKRILYYSKNIHHKDKSHLIEFYALTLI